MYALNNPTNFFYDRNGRLVSTTDPEGHTTSQAYDDARNVQTKTDGSNFIRSQLLRMNRLKSVVNALGEVTSYTYDLNGNMLTQTDGNGNTTIFQYNVANKLIKKTDPNGSGNPKKTESYTYNADGNMKSKVDGNGKTTQYTYDIYGRLLSQTIDNASLNYTYDNNGNQLTMIDSTGTTTRTYDELNRVLAKNVPNIGTTTFEYDIISDVPDGYIGEKTTDPKGNVTLKVNDKAGRLLTVTADNETTTYSYYDNGSRRSVTYPDESTETYTYYKDGLNETLTNQKADGTEIDSYSYTYDEAHNQTSKTDSKGITNYIYDSLNRLQRIAEPNGKLTSYTFDKAGNRLTETVTTGETSVVTTYTYNDQNRLINTITQDESTKEVTYYTYDANGNMYSKDVSYESSLPPQVAAAYTLTLAGQNPDDTSAEYRYNTWNRMVNSTEGDKTVSYGYNGDGQRVEKTVNGQTTRYLYESDKVILEVDGAGSQTARNVYGTNLLSRTMGTDTAYYMYNGHADVTALLTNGEVAATYYYDAFGNVVENSEDAGVNNPYRYAGYQYDSETSLYYLNARYYDAKIARFMQEDTYDGDLNDPLSLNLYTYCDNEPIMYSDPSGNTAANITVGGVPVRDAQVNKGVSTGYLSDIAQGLGLDVPVYSHLSNTASMNINGQDFIFDCSKKQGVTNGISYTMVGGHIQVAVKDLSTIANKSGVDASANSIAWDYKAGITTVNVTTAQQVLGGMSNNDLLKQIAISMRSSGVTGPSKSTNDMSGNGSGGSNSTVIVTTKANNNQGAGNSGTQGTSGLPTLKNTQYKSMINNIINDTSLKLSSLQKTSMEYIAITLLNDGFQSAFVAGVLGNIESEGEAGQFEGIDCTTKSVSNYKEYANGNIQTIGIKNAQELETACAKTGYSEQFGLAPFNGLVVVLKHY